MEIFLLSIMEMVFFCPLIICAISSMNISFILFVAILVEIKGTVQLWKKIRGMRRTLHIINKRNI